MRFVAPETVRIDLADGDWIEIKKELTVGEHRRYLASGFKRAASGGDEIEVDWGVRSLSLVEAYLVGWSARDKDGKPVSVTRQAIEKLASEDFDAIADAIRAHMEAHEAAKKAMRTTTPISTEASA